MKRWLLKPALFFVLLLAVLPVLCNDSICCEKPIEYFNLYTKFSYNNSAIDLPVSDDKSLSFESNARGTLSLGFRYSWLGVVYAFSLPSENVEQYGKTESRYLDVHLNLKRWTINLTDKYYKGFFLSNPETFNSGWNTDAVYPQMPDLITSSTSLSVGYVFKPERLYSNKIYTYNKLPEKSGGSWMASAFVSSLAVYADSGIVPVSVRAYASPDMDDKSIFLADAGLSLGYSYSWVLSDKLFTSFAALPGISFQHVSSYAVGGALQTHNYISGQFLFNLTFGYNTRNFYCGLVSNFETKNYVSKMAVNFEKGGVVLLYRFDTSDWKFMKGIDKVMHPRFLRFALGDKPDR